MDLWGWFVSPQVLSVAAIVISFWTLSQTWRYHPRPRLVVEERWMHVVASSPPDYVPTPGGGHPGGPIARVRVVNYGNGSAHDVRLILKVRGKESQVKKEAAVPPGGSIVGDWDLAKESYLQVGTDLWKTIFDPERVNPKQVKVRLRWRQSPSWWLLRWWPVRLKVERRGWEKESGA